MRVLLIHQYFLEKGDGGGARFNEMAQVWSNQGHEITVLAGMTDHTTFKKATKYKGKYTYKDDHYYKSI